MLAIRILCCAALVLLDVRAARAEPALGPPELREGGPSALPPSVQLETQTAVDIELTVDKDALVLTGERKQEKKVEEKDYWRCERTYGNFYRRIPLGFEVDPKSVKANFRNGVLQLHLPVPEKALHEPKPIAIT